MKNDLINYLILPKGIQSILFKSYVYFVPFLYSLTIDSKYFSNFLTFLFIFILFEFVINPSRYQLNDVADYKEDQQRGRHWQRPVNQENKSLVITVALSRFALGTGIAFMLDVKLGYIAITLLTLQLFYDHFAKKLSPFLAIFSVAIAYPIRSMTVFYGLEIELSKTSILLLLSILFYSTYMVIQWRKYESVFIAKNKLAPKPHSEFFGNPKINFLNFSILLALIIVFVPLVVSLTEIDADSATLIYELSILLVIILSLCDKNIFSKITAQSHNILIALLFLILTLNKFLIGLALSWFSIFALLWYHRIYVERFANNYFNEMHYEKN